jgi:hypothetical protein
MKLFTCIALQGLALIHLADCVVFSWLWNVNPLEADSISKHNSSTTLNPAAKLVREVDFDILNT